MEEIGFLYINGVEINGLLSGSLATKSGFSYLINYV